MTWDSRFPRQTVATKLLEKTQGTTSWTSAGSLVPESPRSFAFRGGRKLEWGWAEVRPKKDQGKYAKERKGEKQREKGSHALQGQGRHSTHGFWVSGDQWWQQEIPKWRPKVIRVVLLSPFSGFPTMCDLCNRRNETLKKRDIEAHRSAPQFCIQVQGWQQQENLKL